MFYLPPDTPSDLLQHRKSQSPGRSQAGVHSDEGRGFPDKVKELIEENKESEFQLTYQDGSYLYLLKGYGKQETGGYSIQIEDLSLWDNAIHLQTTLIGPEEDKDLKDEPSYPYLVVKMKYREEPVIFE